MQHTPGAALVSALETATIDRIIEKGQLATVECYSAFYAPFQPNAAGERVADSGLLSLLRESAVERVFVVGLAADYCVKATAEDAQREGFETFVIEEGTRAVDPEGGWRAELEKAGVRVVSVDGEEVRGVGLPSEGI